VFINTDDGRIDAGIGNDGSAVSLQVGADVDAVLVNDGIFQGRGDAAGASQLGHGLRLFQGDANATFDGVIVNNGSIIASADSANAVGVSIESVALTGVFANFSQIIATDVAIDASSANGVNILNAGQITGDVVLSAEDDVFAITQDSLISGTIDAGNGTDTLNLIGFTEAEATALLATGQFVGFETIITGPDAFDFFGQIQVAQDESDFSITEGFADDAGVLASLDLLLQDAGAISPAAIAAVFEDGFEEDAFALQTDFIDDFALV